MTLPPGQHLIDAFPRFGMPRPAPAIPMHPVIEIRGAVTKPLDLPLAALATLPRRELTADFHCVAGWSFANLRWEGVSFKTLYRTIIEPLVLPDTSISHVVFGRLDRWRSVASIEDALAEDVLVAEHLDGRSLDSDHGAPARLVSPEQFGYISTKHLCRIAVHTSEPRHSSGPPIVGVLFHRHPRARVWQEERNGILPNWLIRPIYRPLIPLFLHLNARQGRQSRTTEPPE